MDILKQLENYGLDKREGKIYLQLLKEGQSTASQVAKETNILRQTTYELLDKLIKKGLVVEIIKNKVKNYQAKDPEIFEIILNEQKEAMKKTIPNLHSIQKKQTPDQHVELFQGITGLKSIYTTLIKDKPKELLEFGNSESFIEILKFYFVQNYMQKRIENKTILRLITEPGERNEKLYGTNKKKYRKTKYHSKLKETNTATYIYDNKVIQITLTSKPIGIIIENEAYAKTQKILFEEFWKNAK